MMIYLNLDSFVHNFISIFLLLRIHLSSICGDGYPCFEISAVNADKPPLSVSQIKDRIKQFEKVGEVLFHHPRFYINMHWS